MMEREKENKKNKRNEKVKMKFGWDGRLVGSTTGNKGQGCFFFYMGTCMYRLIITNNHTHTHTHTGSSDSYFPLVDSVGLFSSETNQGCVCVRERERERVRGEYSFS